MQKLYFSFELLEHDLAWPLLGTLVAHANFSLYNLSRLSFNFDFFLCNADCLNTTLLLVFSLLLVLLLALFPLFLRSVWFHEGLLDKLSEPTYPLGVVTQEVMCVT